MKKHCLDEQIELLDELVSDLERLEKRIKNDQVPHISDNCCNDNSSNVSIII